MLEKQRNFQTIDYAGFVAAKLGTAGEIEAMCSNKIDIYSLDYVPHKKYINKNCAVYEAFENFAH